MTGEFRWWPIAVMLSSYADVRFQRLGGQCLVPHRKACLWAHPPERDGPPNGVRLPAASDQDAIPSDFRVEVNFDAQRHLPANSGVLFPSH